MKAAHVQLPDVLKWGKRTETLEFSPVDGAAEVRWSARYRADDLYRDTSLTLGSIDELEGLAPSFKCSLKSLNFPSGTEGAEVLMIVTRPMAHYSAVVSRKAAVPGDTIFSLDKAEFRWLAAGSPLEVRLAIVSAGAIKVGDGTSIPKAILADSTFTISLASDENGFRTIPTTPEEFRGLNLPSDTPFWVDVPRELDLNQTKEELGGDINVRIATSVYKALSRPGAEYMMVVIAAEVMAALVQAGMVALGTETLREGSVLHGMVKRLEDVEMEFSEVQRAAVKEPERLRAAARAVMSPAGKSAQAMLRLESLMVREPGND